MRHVNEHIRGLLAALCLCGVSTAAWAQTDTVKPRADVVRLRTFWRMGGDAQTTIGRYAGALGDINNDGAADFCVSREPRNPRHVDLTESMIFLGAADSSNVWLAQTIDGYYMARGDFWGTGQPAVVLGDWKSFLGATTQWIRIHRTESDSIETPAALEFDTVLDSAERYYVGVSAAAAADLDRDGYDELVLAVNFTHRNGAYDDRAEFWIYRGGPAFSLAAPAAVLRDTLGQIAGYATRLACGDLDGDGLPEIVALTAHAYGPGSAE